MQAAAILPLTANGSHERFIAMCQLGEGPGQVGQVLLAAVEAWRGGIPIQLASAHCMPVTKTSQAILPARPLPSPAQLSLPKDPEAAEPSHLKLLMERVASAAIASMSFPS